MPNEVKLQIVLCKQLLPSLLSAFSNMAFLTPSTFISMVGNWCWCTWNKNMCQVFPRGLVWDLFWQNEHKVANMDCKSSQTMNLLIAGLKSPNMKALRGHYTPNLKLTCFLCYPKTIKNFIENQFFFFFFFLS